MTENYFNKLNAVDCSEKIDRKGQFNYLSWAWAWAEVKKQFPDTTYKVYEREDGRIYWDDGKTAWVKTGVIVNNIEHIEYLPILDFKNKPIPIEEITSFHANTAIQRSLTKACARHGLGLYVYAGEDLPETVMENDRVETWKGWVAKIDSKEKLIDIYTKNNGEISKKLDSFAKRDNMKCIYDAFYSKAEEFGCVDIMEGDL